MLKILDYFPVTLVCKYVLAVFLGMCTLVDDEAFFRQVGSRDAASISSQQEEDFGWISPDGVHTSLVAQVQCSYLTGHSARRDRIMSRQGLLYCTVLYSDFTNFMCVKIKMTTQDELQKMCTGAGR